jgi:hypothetical protein
MPNSKPEARKYSEDLTDYVGLVFGPIESILTSISEDMDFTSGYGVRDLVEITHKRILRIAQLLEAEIGPIGIARENDYGPLAGDILGVVIERKGAATGNAPGPGAEPDMTTVGAEVLSVARAHTSDGYVCKQCLTQDEKDHMPEAGSGGMKKILVFLSDGDEIRPIWRGRLNPEDTCIRCGKAL